MGTSCVRCRDAVRTLCTRYKRQICFGLLVFLLANGKRLRRIPNIVRCYQTFQNTNLYVTLPVGYSASEISEVRKSYCGGPLIDHKYHIIAKKQQQIMDAHFCIQNNIKSSQIKSNFIYCRYKYYMSSVEQQGNIIFEWLFN